MSDWVSIDCDGRFSAVTDDHAAANALHVGDVASQDQLSELLDQPTVWLKVDGFADGRGFSVARQLRLQGFTGTIQVVGDLLPDQLPMAVESGIDVVLIRAEHAERCEEAQWRERSADKDRFGYQRSVADRRPIGCRRVAR